MTGRGELEAMLMRWEGGRGGVRREKHCSPQDGRRSSEAGAAIQDLFKRAKSRGSPVQA